MTFKEFMKSIEGYTIEKVDIKNEKEYVNARDFKHYIIRLKVKKQIYSELDVDNIGEDTKIIDLIVTDYQALERKWDVVSFLEDTPEKAKKNDYI